ncbi:MAG: hypothetical protein H7A33_00785 [Deltaproteobacteria bacterium]|nr:hypothetical protein [Deltaproteobacteria bacterium]
MKVEVNPESVRTLVPVTVNITETQSEPEIVVLPQSKESHVDAFHVEAEVFQEGYQAQFWLEQTGDFLLQVKADDENFSYPFSVGQQIFLPFSIEFGFFFVALSVVLGGILWRHWKRIKSSEKSA